MARAAPGALRIVRFGVRRRKGRFPPSSFPEAAK
jgi:hypothetical protein